MKREQAKRKVNSRRSKSKYRHRTTIDGRKVFVEANVDSKRAYSAVSELKTAIVQGVPVDCPKICSVGLPITVVCLRKPCFTTKEYNEWQRKLNDQLHRREQQQNAREQQQNARERKKIRRILSLAKAWTAGGRTRGVKLLLQLQAALNQALNSPE